jgi:hypothetical protein
VDVVKAPLEESSRTEVPEVWMKIVDLPDAARVLTPARTARTEGRWSAVAVWIVICSYVLVKSCCMLLKLHDLGTLGFDIHRS